MNEGHLPPGSDPRLGIRDCPLDGQAVRRFVNLYVEENNIRFLNGLDTELRSDDFLTILPGIAGG